MSTQLHRRLKRIEAEVTGSQKAGDKPVVLTAPADEASALDIKRHQEALVTARESGLHAIVISPHHQTRQAAGSHVTYVPTAFEAALEVMVRSPSDRGNLCALDDCLQGLTGNVLKPGLGNQYVTDAGE